MGYVGRERERRKSAQCRHMTRVLLQDLRKISLGCFTVIGYQRGGCLLDALSLGIGELCAFEGNSGVRVLVKVDQGIAVCEPGKMVVRYFLEHPPYFLARLRRPAVAPVSARQIHARLREIR